MDLYIIFSIIFLEIYFRLTVQIVFSESWIRIFAIFSNFSAIFSFILNERQ